MTRLVDDILKLKTERDAVILAHNYQIPEVQDIADFVGDSLGLSQEAAKTEARTIVFCGVHFMAETAAILSPEKTVLLPDMHAGCPMADMIDRQDVLELRREHPDAVFVAYVNTTAEVKAQIDICCTSANAAKVVGSVDPGRETVFIPDKFLGAYVGRQLGRELTCWRGFCPTHAKILMEDVERARRDHPRAKLVVHPECRLEVSEAADAALSTSGILRYCAESPAEEFVIGTEVGILHRLNLESRSKKFHPLSDKAVCPNMKLTNLEKILWCLDDGSANVVDVPEDVAARARGAIDRMLEIV